ncbi:transglutaminase [Aquimarina gracilis]|uniref:Transglutaminase n=1 Tax=Aquimarina gracilis TaxID=874422 RepID=A0ABU5ZRS3_9FLAO|nr:transglutaminase [Aquimarina gracilis]MEB3343951.1 transglutaminase [Aquimarina gracilis]
MRIENKLLLVFALVVSVNIGFCQEFKFGKVSEEELLEESYPANNEAQAAVLFENRDVYIQFTEIEGWQLITEVHKRIKLYKKDGFEYATDEVFLYKANRKKEKLIGLKGITHNLASGKIVETKLKNEGIFKNIYSEKYEQVKFTMPSLQEGSVIEYKYKIVSPFISNIDRIYLQYEIPIKHIAVDLKFPEYFNFKKLTSGYLPVNLKESIVMDKLTFKTKNRTGTVSATNSSKVNVIDFKLVKNTIRGTNVPAFKIEPYSGNAKNYISSISYELSHIDFPSEPIKYYAKTWENVVETIYTSSRFGGELKKRNYFEEDLKEVVSISEEEIIKMFKVYAHVRQRMKWNGKYGVYTSAGVKKAYKERTGNTAEINLMLTAMLTSMGLDANPVLVSSSYKNTALFPTLDGFDYVITRVKRSDGSLAYLDATDKRGLPNILPDRVRRGSGRVIAKNGTSQRVNLRPQEPSINRCSLQIQIDDEGVVNGKFNALHLDYHAHLFRTTHGGKDNNDIAKSFKSKFEIDEIEELKVEGINRYGKGVSESFNFISYDQIEIIDNEMYFSPLLFLKEKENIFKSETRKYPIDFGFGYDNTFMINIRIPDGYEVTELPESKAFKLPENLGAFSFMSSINNGMIQIMVNKKINTPFISADYYPVLKQFYNQIIQKEADQVVIRKI